MQIATSMMSAILFATILALFLSSTYASVDRTQQRGAYGEDVVTATLERLSNADIFTDDFDFLRNIALVDGNYGKDDKGTGAVSVRSFGLAFGDFGLDF